MRTLKDKERFFLITKIFLDCNGPATSKQIAQYVMSCPVRMQTEFTPTKVGTLLRGQSWIKREQEGKKIKYTIRR